MKFIKVVNYKKMWKSKKDNKERPTTTFYLVFDVTNSAGEPKQIYVAIEPHFSNQIQDYRYLDMFAEKRVIKDEQNA